MPRPPFPACAAACVAAALVAAPLPAEAHHAAQSHDGPVWCGTRLAVPADGGVLINDGGWTWTVAAPGTKFVAWSPGCTRVAAVGDRVRVLDPSAASAKDLGPVPAGFESVYMVDGATQPAIVWSPSGVRFAALFAGRYVGTEALMLFDVAAGPAGRFAFPAGVIGAFTLLDDRTALAAVGDHGLTLLRATTTAATRVGATVWKSVAMGGKPLGVVGVREVLGTPEGDMVAVDPATGAERQLGPALWLEGISRTGDRVYYRQPLPAGSSLGPNRPRDSSAAEMPLAGGAPVVFQVGPWDGSVQVEHHGWAPGFLVEPERTQLLLDDGAAPPRVLYDAGKPPSQDHADERWVSHARVSPDGRRAACLVEIGIGRKPTFTATEVSRTDLVVVELSGPPRPRVVATLGRFEDTPVE